MNDTMSLLLATTILATGGVCLYMYKNPDKEGQTDDTEYTENNLFGGLGNFFGSTEDESDPNETHLEEYNEDELDFEPEQKPKQRGGAGKTKRNRRTGGTKRRY
jgi:hypothetical protein